MNQSLPKATPDLAKAVWGRQQSPSARAVARALTQSGHPVHFTTVNRWRGREWRNAKGEHPLDQARAALESALPLMTGDPTSTIDDLLRGSPEGEELGEFSDSELLRKAARELARAVYLVAHMMLLQGAEKLWITRTAAVEIATGTDSGTDSKPRCARAVPIAASVSPVRTGGAPYMLSARLRGFKA